MAIAGHYNPRLFRRHRETSCADSSHSPCWPSWAEAVVGRRPRHGGGRARARRTGRGRGRRAVPRSTQRSRRCSPRRRIRPRAGIGGVGSRSCTTANPPAQDRRLPRDGSGRAAPDRYVRDGKVAPPRLAVRSGAWRGSLRDFGTLPLATVLEPAIRYAAEELPRGSTPRRGAAGQRGGDPRPGRGFGGDLPLMMFKEGEARRRTSPARRRIAAGGDQTSGYQAARRDAPSPRNRVCDRRGICASTRRRLRDPLRTRS